MRDWGFTSLQIYLLEPRGEVVVSASIKRCYQAAEHRSAMFEVWDMLSGRVQPELGGHESYLDIIGVNYYDCNQWWNHGETIWRHQLEYRPFREILVEVYERYRRPVFISETGTDAFHRPPPR